MVGLALERVSGASSTGPFIRFPHVVLWGLGTLRVPL